MSHCPLFRRNVSLFTRSSPVRYTSSSRVPWPRISGWEEWEGRSLADCVDLVKFKDFHPLGENVPFPTLQMKRSLFTCSSPELSRPRTSDWEEWEGHSADCVDLVKFRFPPTWLRKCPIAHSSRTITCKSERTVPGIESIILWHSCLMTRQNWPSPRSSAELSWHTIIPLQSWARFKF